MPANRRPRDREEKRQELITAASVLFAERGFDQTSMTRIAESAGVTPTTIYWYVDDKDALLVAVLDRLLADAMQEFATDAGPTLIDQALWALDRLHRHRGLINVVHARSERAPTVAAWHDQFHALVDGIVVDGLAEQGVPEQDRRAIGLLTTFAVEGLLAHPTDPSTTRAVLEKVLGPAPRP